MSLSFLYWLFFILWVVLSVWGHWPAAPPAGANWRPWSMSLLLVILLFILGWRVFGFVIVG